MNITFDVTSGEMLDTQTTINFVTPTTYNPARANELTGLVCNDPSLTQQNGKDQADINFIVNQFLKTGMLPQIPMPPSLEEFGEIFDFQSAMDTLNEANRSFMALDAEIRGRFLNDPARFVQFVHDKIQEGESGLEDLRKMNLAVPKTPAPAEAPVVTPPAPNASEPLKGA